jgi:hypothetical protein
MNRFPMFRFAVFALALGSAAVAVETAAGDDKGGYEKGTITPDAAVAHRYLLQGTDAGYRFSNCGDFTNGQAVEYRVKENKVYIRRDGDKDSKCPIEATMMVNTSYKPITYVKGTILGFGVRRDVRIGGGGGGGNGTPGSPVTSYTRHAKVYELRGADFVYEVDYCGAFQSGKFSPGQEVEYRVDGDRLYIRHDGDKEYSCQLEGQRLPDDAKPAAAAAAAAAPSSQR